MSSTMPVPAWPPLSACVTAAVPKVLRCGSVLLMNGVVLSVTALVSRGLPRAVR